MKYRNCFSEIRDRCIHLAGVSRSKNRGLDRKGFKIKMSNILILPVYNEADNLEALVREVKNLEPKFDIYIIDDNSPDGTGVIADKISQQYSGIYVLHRPNKLGLGTAYIQGFKFALDRDYKFIMCMDSDFSHNPKDLPRLLLEVSQGSDLVLGSRYVDGIRVNNWSFSKLMLSKFANVYTDVILRAGLKDFTTGFRCYNSSALKNIDFYSIKTKGYGFTIEITYRFFKKGFKIKEVPIIFSGRKKGKSKMSFAIKIEAFFAVISMRLF